MKNILAGLVVLQAIFVVFAQESELCISWRIYGWPEKYLAHFGSA